MVLPLDELKLRVQVAKNGLRPNEIYPKELPSWYVKEIQRLSERYRPIRWLPLDIPKFEFENYDEFLKVFDTESIPILRTKPDSAEPWDKEGHPLGKESHYYKPAFKGLYTYTSNPEKFNEEKSESVTFAYKYCPHPIFQPLTDHVLKHFPFFHIDHMYIWESVKEIALHTDQHKFWEAPTEFRIMIHDENNQPTLFVADVDHYDQNYIDLPKDTNAFCWSNGTQLHGSDYFGKRKQLLVIAGTFSISKLEDLIERSIVKYKDQLNYKLEI
jgi:hypothetical protein